LSLAGSASIGVTSAGPFAVLFFLARGTAFDIAVPRQIFSCANLAACLSASRSVS